LSRQRFVYFPAARAETIDDHHKITFKDQRGNLKHTHLDSHHGVEEIEDDQRRAKLSYGPPVRRRRFVKMPPCTTKQDLSRLSRWRGSLELADESYSSQYERRLIVSSRQLCLEAKVPLFHNDRDFDAIARVKRLKVYYPKPRH
jgi:hypothetical protein